MTERTNADHRVLVLMPTGQDAARTCTLLAEEGLPGVACSDFDEFCREIAAGAGVALLTDEVVSADAARYLSAALADQPPWSDLPVVVLTRPGADSWQASLRESANVTLVERPVRKLTLLSVVRAALRARRHQFQVRDLLAERQKAAEALLLERERLRITLASIGDAVISTDAEGRVAFMNGVAEALTGWPQAEALGRPLSETFNIVNQRTRQQTENPALRALREGAIVGLANHTVLIARDGVERPIDDSAAPIREGGAALGAVLVFRDVSERQRAEVAMARLAAIVESSEDAIISKTLDGVIRSWNAAAERLFGYTAEEAVGRPVTLIIPPERIAEEQVILSQLRRGERVNHFETVRMARDGRRLDISRTSSPVRDDEGVVVGASKIARDITEIKRFQAEQERLAYTLRLALAAADQGTWEWEPETDLITLSDRAAEIYGLQPGRRYTRAWLRDLIRPEYRDRDREVVARAGASRADYDNEYPVEFPDGRVTWIAVRGRGVYDDHGKLIRMLGVAQDVTARKEAEASLRESEARYRAIVEATPECVKLVAPDGTLLQMNQAGLTMVEGDESAIGQCVYNVIAPEHRDAFRAFNELVCRGERGTLEFDFIGLRGTRRHMETSAVPLAGPDCGFIQLGVTRDVTERKCAEEALREADRRKDEFLALLAHELRNPLAPLRNGLQVLRLAAGDANTLAQARAMMDRQLSHMVRLIDDLLDISRITRNKLELRRARVLLADVISSAVETARPAIEEAGHELAVTLPHEPVHLDADLTRLAQVFGNLLSNSAKYTPRGGHIRLLAECRAQEVIVSVRDSGIGIPAKSLGSIFDMFSQVDRTIERSTGGLGIGLALVRGLVGMHAGTVTAESPGPGEGSTFTVRLPIVENQPESAPASPEEEEPSVHGARRRILVVDDNRDSAISMAMMLRLLGDEVRVVHDGVEAVEEAGTFQPQVILMDVGMPRLNGLDATRSIRELPGGRDIIIFALTGWGQEGDKERSLEAGCDGHLVKPVDLPDLEKLLKGLARSFG